MVLRGLGASLALPLLDSMVPALTAMAKTAAKSTPRLGIVYVPNGVVMEQWTPAASGTAFEFSPSLQPLSAFRDRLLILTGLTNETPRNSHETGATRFLTGMSPKRTTGADLGAGISMDQVAAKESAKQVPLGSLELALESGQDVGTCGNAYSCAYANTICWRGPSTPLPMDTNPRVVFERLLGDGGTNPAARRARFEKDRSILDAVTEKVARLQQGLGARDRAKLTEYLEAVRDIERRIAKSELRVNETLPEFAQPIGIPAVFEEHAKLMFDLQVLAYQADLTRVITFMVSREYSGRSYPQIGVPDAHHSTSHHQGDPQKIEKLAKINGYHTSLLAYYLEKLRSTPDGDGSLLDQVFLLYGAGLSDGNRHASDNLPVLLLGGGAGQLKGGRHVSYPETTPMANLHLTLLHRMGVHVDRFADSTGELELSPAVS
jgi:hypothetical protein